MCSEDASSSSQLKAAVPPKRALIEKQVQKNETMENLADTRDKLDRVKKRWREHKKIETNGQNCSRNTTRSKNGRSQGWTTNNEGFRA